MGRFTCATRCESEPSMDSIILTDAASASGTATWLGIRVRVRVRVRARG